MHALRSHFLAALLMLAIGAVSPAYAYQGSLRQRVETALAAAPPGARFGLLVTTEDGRELIAINADDRFMPASNTKMLTTAAAFATLSGLDQPDRAGGAAVRLEGNGRMADVILTGHGDARLSSAPDCITNCLAALADAVAARTRRVRHVIGDDSLFPDQRWSPGMSWNNIQSRYGTAISALTLDDNELVMRVTPGVAGERPTLDMLPWYEVENLATTVAEGGADLQFRRMPNRRTLRLTGTIAAGAEPEIVRMGIDDPAHFAAWRLRTLLEARGVRVTGDTEVRHRPFSRDADDPAHRSGPPMPRPPEPAALARLTPPPLTEDLTRINKESQNLHSELMIRRLGLVTGSGSIEDGVAAIAAMMERAGVPRTAWDLSDGSGMSTYNRASPRAVNALLRWAATQPWGAAWLATFPVAGVDGTLARRFRDTPLQGRLFAKTGTLNATNALSGYMIARSGRTLTFSFYANDVPGDVSATEFMDRALNLIAAEN
ncbi:D-alanyl-D-alanine carboxypeptidase/D-alanyl-D-alanine-endopeptidase [Sphingosinicella sp. LHD-64]|uniref:D-alanyl-D-alanine carboxypeptidase/D-alanyl-D-alanine endopeptidase n=1 Tax=Sphingosinicella sp. LHD-64 TaxID=3072139 RepID=UPI00280FA2D2|nr:D-alanyl-D-alanine carboxypeptidase/D-alanyl-D-alanine-endopeptidase [Sphingosinicella sp. LHD-64]MDQ8757631.1 D-alanyl-D-alanine carboxypeptidase/D-alanyl-D-alanine-endopeptidase [Sphingosinicella sp. LHD-64]